MKRVIPCFCARECFSYASLPVQALLCGSITTPHSSPLNTPQKSPANLWGDCQGAAAFDLGTDRKWAHAVSTLARHVHAAPGEYVATLFAAVQELDRRAEDVEGTAGGEAVGEEARLRCLAVAALLLEAVKGLPELREADAHATAVLEQAVAAQVRRAARGAKDVGHRQFHNTMGLPKTAPTMNVLQLRLWPLKNYAG